ncbi:MAG: aminotransferase class V-fold PLP-dependent enzyme [Deltaproteobacteria bacterium]|nr:aminotransferase class V-fold PLP-dependent enzyme [Deltaproteobacteria bacterium]MBW2047579.1 aminotransferase class V-fold PLP-dependent enzyme [Deltaproteobacteria bacterium]MBW2111653.1 aminotransferase class V-fold PLP-dependent enzyme [Deltaproteobacteria bacterium]MBW2352225.1 aminotransferase class V-fold PLP-dependent enzyme [Deltaproteobacteria bacterium]
MDEEDFFRIVLDLKPDALRFEPGTMNVAGIYALGATLELLLEVGIDNIHRRVLHINDLLFQGLKERNLPVLTPMAVGERSGILSFIPAFMVTSMP